MKNKYVDFITDEHLLNCIANLHKSYLEAKNDISKKKFYSNKIDTIKLTFDTKFNDLDEETLIEAEILRQIDKSINNAIGTFHEEVLGGIIGFEKGNLSGYDIKAQNNTLFADIKNKHNTMNSSAAESLFQKLSKYADKYPKSKCYWVQILATSSFNEKWEASLNGTSYKHDRVYKISGDQFYKLLSKQDDAFFQLYKSLPKAIADFLKTIKKSEAIANSALTEISESASKSKRTILDEITFENFSYYLGFDKL
jgi:translation elongation factor EF-G